MRGGAGYLAGAKLRLEGQATCLKKQPLCLSQRGHIVGHPLKSKGSPMSASRFEIDPDAPRVEVDEIRWLTNEERPMLFPHAREICGTIQDNDREAYYLTLGGQFLRETESDIYVCGSDYAREMLAGLCDDEVMEELVAANVFNTGIPGITGNRA